MSSILRLHEAVRILGMDTDTLRRKLVGAGDSVVIHGVRLRIFRTDFASDAERRLDRYEVERLARSLAELPRTKRMHSGDPR